MIRTGCIAILTSLAMSALPAPALAQAKATVADAAKCHAVVRLKLKEEGLILRDRVQLYNALDWFKAQGELANSSSYANQEVSYGKAYEEARDNGDPIYGKAVKGCLDFYQAKTGK